MTTQQQANRIALGDHISRGCRRYVDHFGDWVRPMLLVSGIYIVALFSCLLPALLATGPLACGLHYCAIRAVRQQGIDIASLQRGKEVAGRAIIAWFLLCFLQYLPMLVLQAVFFIIVAFFGPEELRRIERFGQQTHFAEDLVVQEGNRIDLIDEPEAQTKVNVPEESSVDNVLPPGADRLHQAERQQQLDRQELPTGFLLVFMAMYGVMLLAIFLMALWTLWIGTRLLFVLPLIAERKLGVTAAIRLSWTETRERFWELLLLNFLASFLSMLGMYAFYVGLVFSLPIYFTLVASVYDERFPARPSAA